MKIKTLISLGFIAGGTLPAYADTFTYSDIDSQAASGAVGEVCSENGAVIVACKCGTAQTPTNSGVTQECQENSDFDWGCKFQGSMGNNAQYWCAPIIIGTACNVCGCKNIAQNSDWTSSGSNRVSRTVQTATSSGYTCNVSTSTEYGCAVGYYQSSGTGASMTCTRCPSSGGVYGTNAIGTTAITSCYIPSGTSFSETTGSGSYTGNCYYTN